MSIYNLIEYISNYSEATESLLFYSEDEAPNFNDDYANANNFKSFRHNVELFGNTVAQPAPNQANGILKNATIFVPLKQLSVFGRSFEMPLISCKND